jgi:hypothetical protein
VLTEALQAGLSRDDVQSLVDEQLNQLSGNVTRYGASHPTTSSVKN